MIENLDVPFIWEAVKSFNKIILDCIGRLRPIQTCSLDFDLEKVNTIHDTPSATEEVLLLIKLSDHFHNKQNWGHSQQVALRMQAV